MVVLCSFLNVGVARGDDCDDLREIAQRHRDHLDFCYPEDEIIWLSEEESASCRYSQELLNQINEFLNYCEGGPALNE
jgi:hypothetical protein